MKTLEQYNRDFWDTIANKNLENKAGVLCSICYPTWEVEMIFLNPNVINTSNPPSQTVKCPRCCHIDYKMVE